MIASGNMLDQIKKHVFYNRDYDVDKLINEFANIVLSLETLKRVISETRESEVKLMPYPGEVKTGLNPRIFHSIVGITTESVELLEALSAESFDNVNFLEELGDVNWYQAIGIDEAGGDFEQILTTNIEKLKKRYPEKFTSQNAIERDLQGERELLDSNLSTSDSGC